MKIFEKLYKNNIQHFESFTDINYTVNENKFNHQFLFNQTPINITITFPLCSDNVLIDVSQWFFENPLFYSKLLKNKSILKSFLGRKGLIPEIGDMRYTSLCCQSLCTHTLYSFYILDNIIDSNPGLLLKLCGIDIDFIMNKLASSLIQKTNNLSSKRVLDEGVIDSIFEIEFEEVI